VKPRAAVPDPLVEQLADRERFRVRVVELLVDMTIAARRLGAADPHQVAIRALERLLEEA
jgi:hypothetical protein